MLLALASAVFLGSESLGSRDRILLSQISEFPFRQLPRLAEKQKQKHTAGNQPAGYSWHRAPLGPMAIDLFNVKTFAFFLLCSSL
jgi:hypothetical protein